MFSVNIVETRQKQLSKWALKFKASYLYLRIVYVLELEEEFMDTFIEQNEGNPYHPLADEHCDYDIEQFSKEDPKYFIDFAEEFLKGGGYGIWNENSESN